MSAEGQFLIGKVAFEAIRASGLEPDAVGGLTIGADPIAYSIAHESWRSGRPVDAFSVRKAVKSHGTGRRIEGAVEAGAGVLVVEDALTTGKSTLEAIGTLQGEGHSIVGVLTLVDREGGGSDRIREAGWPLITLFTAAELLERAGHSP